MIAMTRSLVVCVLVPLLLAVSVAAARAQAVVDTVTSLEQRLACDASGDAVLSLTVVLAAAGPGRLTLPFAFARADSFRLEGRDVAFARGEDGLPAPLQRVARRGRLVLDLGPLTRAGETVVVRCRLRDLVDWAGVRGEFAAYPLSREFVNDSEVSIGDFRLVLALPAGFQIRRITASEPGFKPEESPEPPYTVGREAGITSAAIHAAHLRPGGRVRLGVQAERTGRGVAPLLWGLGIAVAYLWAFRDLTSARTAAREPSTTSTRSAA